MIKLYNVTLFYLIIVSNVHTWFVLRKVLLRLQYRLSFWHKYGGFQLFEAAVRNVSRKGMLVVVYGGFYGITYKQLVVFNHILLI